MYRIARPQHAHNLENSKNELREDIAVTATNRAAQGNNAADPLVGNSLVPEDTGTEVAGLITLAAPSGPNDIDRRLARVAAMMTPEAYARADAMANEEPASGQWLETDPRGVDPLGAN